MFWILAAVIAVVVLLFGGKDRPRRGPRDPQRMREDGCL
jgi:hypothetical protein